VSDEPIAFEDADALERLAGIADEFLAHDRPIHTRVDDSVMRVGGSSPRVMVRRSRGYVPDSIALPVPAPRPLLACGAELKSTFCLARGSRAWVGHHIGDLKNYETLCSFRGGVAHFERLFAVAPEVVAHDLHPDYLSTSYALEREGVVLVGVQHHHAHLAACLAEHGLDGPAVGAIFDGSGYGPDGTVWGGELLVGDLREFTRVGHLWPVRLPGGDRAVREPWRMACSWLVECGLEQADHPVAKMCRTGFNSPLTTSAGRLFDAVAALCGLRDEVTYEGQAAVELEAACDVGEPGAYRMPDLDARETIAAVVADLQAGVDVGRIAMRFHRGLAVATAAACAATGLEHAVLSGGVFQNRILLGLTIEELERHGLLPLVPRLLPPNDGGISYGQAAVAAANGC
jgi:hydrogenase maturation protein HypF